MSVLDEQTKDILQLQEEISKLQKKRNDICDKMNEYQKMLQEQMMNSAEAEHKKYIGKAFGVVKHDKNERGNISALFAYKIIDVLPPPNCRYAVCISVYHGEHRSCWPTTELTRETLGVWNPVVFGLSGDGPTLMENSQEMSEEEWQEIVDTTIKVITKNS